MSSFSILVFFLVQTIGVVSPKKAPCQMQFAIQDCFVKILSTGILEKQATRKIVSFIDVNTGPLNFERKRKQPSSSNMKRSEC